MQHEIERRVVAGQVQAKLGENVTTVTTLAGYGAVFNQETVIAGMFREVIDRHAFDGVLDGDIRSAFNHSPDYIIGRTANGTLRVSTDDRGLRYEVDLNPNDPDAQRVGAKVARGDVDQSSFAFSLTEDGEEWDYSETKSGKLPLRRIMRVEELYELGPVAFPAYPQTSVSARSLEMAAKEPEPEPPVVDMEAVARADVRRRRLELDTIDE